MTEHILTVFRSRLRPEHSDEYAVVADEMAALADTMPGFVSRKSFVADDGERVTIVLFADAESQARWRDHPDHRRAQRLGIKNFYSDYSIEVAAVTYRNAFTRESPAADH